MAETMTASATPGRQLELLTVEDVCRELKISRSALYSMRYIGQAPPAIKVGRALRFRRSDLDQWIADQPASSSSQGY